MAEFSVRQVRGDMRKTAAKLRNAARKEMQQKVRRSVTDSTRPLRNKVRDAARDTLPHRGGLNRWAAVLPDARTTFKGKDVEFRLRLQKSGHDLESVDKGRVRHKVFGHAPWVNQSVPAGFFTKTVRDGSREVEQQIRADLERYIQSLDNG